MKIYDAPKLSGKLLPTRGYYIELITNATKGHVKQLRNDQFVIQRITRFPGRKNSGHIEEPMVGIPLAEPIAGIPGMGKTVHVPSGKFLGEVLKGTGRVIASHNNPLVTGMSILDTLNAIRDTLTVLGPDDRKICNAILLVCEHKRYRMLTEPGASAVETAKALEAQGEDRPKELNAQMDKLVEKGVLKRTEFESGFFYQVVT